MSNLPEKILKRFQSEHKALSKVIESAIQRDVNEADTVLIVSDIFARVLGYDKYTEITREFIIKKTFCDLALKINNDVVFLIEVKAIGIKLNENHTKQAVDYAANQGVDWVILTNGVTWNIYKLRFAKPINATQIFSFNFLELSLKNREDQEQLYLISREGVQKNAILALSEYRQVVNKFYVSAILLEDSFVDQLCKKIKKINPKARVEKQEMLSILQDEVIKRDIIESDEIQISSNEYTKFLRKQARNKTKNLAKNTIQKE